MNGVSLGGLLAGKGLPDAHDVPPHLINTVEFSQCFRQGVFWPEWLPDLSGGYGGPNPLFYAPLSFHLTGRLHQAGLGLKQALKLVAAIAMVTAFIGMFVWAAHVWLWPGGLLAATLYLFAPYHLTDLYVRFALPELLGMALTPWLFFLATLQMEGRWRSAWKPMGIGLSLLFLVHNISVILFIGLLVGYALCLLVLEGKPKEILGVLKALCLALCLSAFFWIPVLVDRDNIRLPQDLSMKYAWQTQLLTVGRLWDCQWPGTRENLPLYLGRLHILRGGFALVSAVVMLPFGPRPAIAYLGFAAVTAFHLFLALDRSRWIWAHTPLPAIQFPWRFLSAAALGFSFLTPLCLWTLNARPRLQMAVGLGLSFLVVVQYRTLCNNKIVDHVLFTSDQLIRSCETGDFENKYVPAGAQDPMERGPIRFRIVAGVGSLSTLEMSPERHRLIVDAREKVTIDVRIYHFPGWEALLDGKPVELVREESFGGMRLSVESGRHLLEVRFRPTPLRWWTRLVSLSAIVVLLFEPCRSALLRWASFTPFVLGVCGLLLVLRERLLPTEPEPYLHRARIAQVLQQHDKARRAIERAAALRPGLGWISEQLEIYREKGLQARYYGNMSWKPPTMIRREYSLSLNSRSQIGFPPIPGTFSALLTARLTVPQGGNTSFALESDDGSSLYVDGQRVVDNEGQHGVQRKEGSLVLKEGTHELAIRYFNGWGDAILRVYWRLPGAAWEIVPVRRLTPSSFPWAERLTASGDGR